MPAADSSHIYPQSGAPQATDPLLSVIVTASYSDRSETPSMQELLKGLTDVIHKAENPPRLLTEEGVQTWSKPRWLTITIRGAEILVLWNRGWSCSFRFKTTLEAAKYILQILKQAGHSYAGVVSKTSATLFFATDAGVTVATAEKSVAMLKNLPSEIKIMLGSLREVNGGQLPFFRLILLTLLLPGGMWGAYNKGDVGSRAVADMIISLASDNPSPLLITICRILGATVGGSSALCFAAFQGLNGLKIMCAMKAVSNSPFWAQYLKTEKIPIFITQLITFIISVAMTLITVMATFYARESFELNLRSVSEALFISSSSLVLNTIFTVGPNYVLKNIKEQHAALLRGDSNAVSDDHHTPCFRVGTYSIKSLGVVSSTGNSLAVFPAIIFILFLISTEKDLSNESTQNIIVAMIAWLLLAVPMLPRDYAYYTKPLLELYEKKFGQQNDVAVSDAVRARPVENNESSYGSKLRSAFTSCASFFGRCCKSALVPDNLGSIQRDSMIP